MMRRTTAVKKTATAKKPMMKKGGKMPMVKVGDKKVPAFTTDGKVKMKNGGTVKKKMAYGGKVKKTTKMKNGGRMKKKGMSC
jgi:hypothetical protein